MKKLNVMNFRNFLRNPEIRRNLVVRGLMAACFIILAAFLDLRFGFLSAVFSLIFMGNVLKETYTRYCYLAELSLEIDRILHDNTRFDLSCFAEGELSILSSEVYKMTIRLREQADALQKDKTYLADSMADISHQIRTPLTSINLIANFLSEDELSEGRRRQLIQELLQLLSRIDWLITTLLKISKLDAGSVRMVREPVLAEELVQKAASLIAIPMELREQKLVIHADEGANYLGDMTWSVEAVGNILKNCMEHTPEGGTITVAIRDNTLFTEIVISDNGEGFAEEDIPHLFERFYKGKNAGNNSFGIGLALSQMIVQAQDGIVRAANRKDGGAEFVLRFYKTTI